MALRMASPKDFWISVQFILKPSAVTMKLFSRRELILQQTSKSWGAAAMRYASLIRAPSPFRPCGNSAMMDESAAMMPTTSPIIFLKCQDPFACVCMCEFSAKRDINHERPKRGKAARDKVGRLWAGARLPTHPGYANNSYLIRAGKWGR